MNITEDNYFQEEAQPFFTILNAMLYSAVFVVGIIGNALVMYAILYFPKMQTVTNIYILNLAIADVCFLLGVPFLIVTMLRNQWVFGPIVCKVYMVSTSINQFTTALFLLVISVDRYVAVCHPNWHSKLRNTRNSRIVSFVTWLLSILLIFPIFQYTAEVSNHNGKKSCVINWWGSMDATNETFLAEGNISRINGGLSSLNSTLEVLYSKRIEWVQSGDDLELAFITYTFVLSFALPLGLMAIFYGLIVHKMMTFTSEDKTKDTASRKKVTKMVLVVITVYVICWLPHWIIQWLLVRREIYVSRAIVILYMFISWLSYSNSAINPILYGLLSKNFRKTFFKAYSKAGRPLLPRSRNNNHENIIDNTNKTIDTSFSDSQDSAVYGRPVKPKQDPSMETTSL